MSGDGAGVSLIGRGRQDQAPPASMLALQKCNDILVVREVVRLQRHPIGDAALQGSNAAKQPEGQAQGIGRVAAHKAKAGLDRGIGRHQCAVQIHE